MLAVVLALTESLDYITNATVESLTCMYHVDLYEYTQMCFP